MKQKQEPDWTIWHHTFKSRAGRPLPEVSDGFALLPKHRAPLLRSMAIFQLGEAGEGRIANQIDKVALHNIDDNYRAALKLFVQEEGRHAKILGNMLRALGGKTLSHNLSEKLFVWGRRLIGIRLKLLVLLAAEVVGLVFYGILRRGLGQSACAQALEEIMADEALHYDFHLDFFAQNLTTAAERYAWWMIWWVIATSALLTVAVDHRTTLRVLDVSPRTLLRKALVLIRRAGRQIHGGQRPIHHPTPALGDL